MASLEDGIINGELNEDQILEEMLRQDVSQRPSPQAAAPAPQVIQPRPVKMLVSIPKDESGNPDHKNSTVTKVEVLPDGNFKVLEPTRPVNANDKALMLSGRREVLSATESAPETKRPWWHYALGVAGVAVAAGGIYVGVQALRGGDDVEEEVIEEDDEEEED